MILIDSVSIFVSFFSLPETNSKKFLKIVAPCNFRRFRFLLEKPPFFWGENDNDCDAARSQSNWCSWNLDLVVLIPMAWSVLANCPLTIRCSTVIMFFVGGGERGLVCRKHFNHLIYIFSSFLSDLTKSTGICGPFTRYHRLHVLARFRDSLPVVFVPSCVCLCVCHLQHLGRWSPEFLGSITWRQLTAFRISHPARKRVITKYKRTLLDNVKNPTAWLFGIIKKEARRQDVFGVYLKWLRGNNSIVSKIDNAWIFECFW